MDAVAAYDRVIANYPGSRVRAAGILQARNGARAARRDATRARESYEAVIKQFPDSEQAVLAKQRLEAVESAGDTVNGTVDSTTVNGAKSIWEA